VPVVSAHFRSLFGVWTWVGPRNHVRERPDNPGEGAFWGAGHLQFTASVGDIKVLLISQLYSVGGISDATVRCLYYSNLLLTLPVEYARNSYVAVERPSVRPFVCDCNVM